MTIEGGDLRATRFGYSKTDTNNADAFDAYVVASPYGIVDLSNLGPYAVAIGGTNGVPLRTFTIDTSFEPYRREAFRHRTMPAQRQSINFTNIAGEGTVNTEGLWRREQDDWSMGAGQLLLDQKRDSQETRFRSSFGLDAFTMPYQMTLQNAVTQNYYSTNNSTFLVRCGGFVIVTDGNEINMFSGTSWSSPVSVNLGVTGINYIYSVTANDTYVYIGTDVGIYYFKPSTSTFTLTASANCYATNDTVGGGSTTPATFNGYTMYSSTAPSNTIILASGSTLPSVNTLLTGTGIASGTVVTAASGNTITLSQSITQSSATLTLTGGSTTSGSTGITVSSNSGLNVGSPISGPNIAANTTVTAVSGSTNITLSQPATATGASLTFTAYTPTVFSVTALPAPTFSGYHLVRWIGNTVFAAAGNRLYVFSSVHTPGTAPQVAIANAASPPDLMMIHPNPNWIWSDATLGASQAYVSGYVFTTTDTVANTFQAHLDKYYGYQSYTDTKAHRYGGSIYRMDLTQNTTVTSFSQPYTLNYPVQALPMSPDEYPTCLYAYLNFIFIGTSKGIRMAQTLSAYDPNQQQAGDLKSGPTIPNILQPVTLPVTAIMGDDRFVWFAWNNYTDPLSGITTPSYTGLGRLDLSTYIKGDPLAPAYQSDLMVFGTGVVQSIDWDPILKVPMFSVEGQGAFSKNVNAFVESGTLWTGYFDFGVPDQKIPVYFDYGVFLSDASTASATLYMDPNDSFEPQVIEIESYNVNSYSEIEKVISFTGNQIDRAQQFEVALNVTGNGLTTPTIHRWTVKGWPTTVSETQIMVVIQSFSVNSVEGLEVYNDPYDTFSFFEQLRENQTITQYQEGPLICNVVVDGIDWLPTKRRDIYESGFEGDCVVTLKTIGGYVPYSPVSTS